MSLLVRSEILGRFVSPFNTGEKYSCDNTDNLPQVIQMKISEKPKTFCQFFFADLEYT